MVCWRPKWTERKPCGSVGGNGLEVGLAVRVVVARAVQWSPHRVLLEQAHGLEIVVGVEGEAMVDSSGLCGVFEGRGAV